MSSDRTGLMIIRVWVEDGSAEPLRASVRHTIDVASGSEERITLTDVGATAEFVRRWLREFLPS